MGSVVYPAAPMQMNALPPTLAYLRQAQVDLGMDTLWHEAPQASPSSRGRCGTLHKGNSSGRWCDEDSDDSTDTPHSYDSLACSSDEGTGTPRLSPLALQAEALRAEEEEMACGFWRRIAQEVEPEVMLDSEGSHAVKNTFVDIPSPTQSSARQRWRSVPKDTGSRKML